MDTSKIKNFWGAQKSAKISDQSVQMTLIIVGAVVLLALAGGYAVFQMMPPSGNVVSVQGNSQIKAIPDLVTVYFSVETKGTDAKDAKDKNAEIVDAVVTNLVKAGFERADIVTENFNVYPEYSWMNSQQKILDYKATHNIRVEMPTSESDKIGDAIDAGVDGGALISYINFELTVAKQNEYKALAFKQAAEDATIKAQALASGVGKKLGKLVSISSNEFYYQPWRMYSNDAMASGGAEAKAAATTIQPGEQDVNAQVSVSYKIV